MLTVILRAAITYSVISPIINGLAFVTFLLFYPIERNGVRFNRWSGKLRRP